MQICCRAVSIAYGLAFSTLLTLIYTPSLVMILHDVKCVINWLWEGEYTDHSIEEYRKNYQEMMGANHET